jgi:hypothetical protein
VVQPNEMLSVRSLTLWQTYTRQEVHDIFSPDTIFTPQAGTWGLQGIVSVPGRAGSYVFFVTFGRTQGEYSFDESITDDGVLTWQSQPQQQLADRTVQDLIHHDDRTDAIHLFLRTRSRVPYTYCGTLGYLDHDRERERPVHFQWQLMNWPAPAAVVEDLGIELAPGEPTPAPATGSWERLIETAIPRISRRGGSRSIDFLQHREATHPDQSARNAELGLAGELLVLEMERNTLIAAGRPDLASRVVHVAAVEGDAAGFDIRSYGPNGDVRIIEVKTTTGPVTTAFFATPNELQVSKSQSSSYVLIRVFGYDWTTNTAKYYQVRGAMDAAFVLLPTEFQVSLAPSE